MSRAKPKSPRPPRIGELVYLRNVGYPFDRTDDGHESWEGASCTVTRLNTGAGNAYIEVRPLIPIRIRSNGEVMTHCLFRPDQIVRESRPWLRKHLRALIRVRDQLSSLRETIVEHLS